jgi:TRAP-type C4-dicarboxylate transport system substrate-binding protein
MLSFDSKKLVFKFNGKEQEIEYPTVKKVNQFRKELKNKEHDEVETVVNFICSLGAERETIESLRVSQLNKLVEELTNEISDSKKN